MYKRILCPIDGSPPSTRGMQEAMRLARESGAVLRFIHVVSLQLGIPDISEGVILDDMGDVMRKEGAKLLQKAVNAAYALGVSVDSEMLETYGGHVGEAIIAAAEKWQADLIIMGTHGYHGLNHLFMGSEAEHIVRYSPVPVLLTRSSQLLEQHRKSESLAKDKLHSSS